MSGVRGGLLSVLLVAVSACNAVAESVGVDQAAEPQGVTATESQPNGDPGPASGATIPVVTPATTPATEPANGDEPATTEPATASTTEPTTTTTSTPASAPEPEPVDDGCVVVVGPGDSLELIATRFDDPIVDVASLAAENALPGIDVTPGTRLDVCVDNGLDDLTGAERTERNAAVVEAEARRAVEAQQSHLNTLFAGYGIRELLVDGDSGPVTRQRLCAARLALGLPVSTNDMVPGSAEEQALMATDTLPIPYTSAILSERWIVIDRTCQVMFVGTGTERLDYVFPTSTGVAQFPTRSQNRTRAYRFNPANGNGGWHNSTTYPAADDNPLNGNMYRPLYFDRGQAIHGANNVPRSPASHGCARLRVGDQDALLAWLGLSESGPTTNSGRINVTVNVQGRWNGN